MTGSLERLSTVNKTAPAKSAGDSGRKWMWWFLGALAAAQFYLVRELLGALILFAMVFAAISVVIAAVYFIQQIWVMGMASLQRTAKPLANFSRRGMALAEENSRKAFRRLRPRSVEVSTE